MSMKKIGLGCLALALCWPAMSSVRSLAQDTNTPPPAQQPDASGQPGGRPSMEQMRERQIDRMTKELSLTPDQVTQLRAIDKDSSTQMMAVRQDTSLSREDQRAKMMTIRQNSQTKIRAMLTDDQKPKYDAMLARERERGPRGEGAPPPSPQL
jgi:Spy/CpxP family protein refolding chaperone